jgi:phosphatidate phosphatase APP1
MAPASANAASLPFQVRMRPGDPREFPGHAVIVPAQGLSVVSDIDDTIKHSHVRDRHELMLNTFAREFTAVPGMAERYRALAAEAVALHYVSSGPIQLYPPLAAFLVDAGFPPGSVHLRDSTSLQNVVPTHAVSRAHKLSTIRTLLDDFPQRQFVLIGDSGEADPEIYGQLAREQPTRIVAIHIRDVTGDTRASDRYRSAFEGVAEERWSLFTQPPAFLPTP